MQRSFVIDLNKAVYIIHSYTAMMMPQIPMPAPSVADPMHMAATQQALINQQAVLMVRTCTLSILQI